MTKLTNTETADALAKLADKYRQTEGEIANFNITFYMFSRLQAARTMRTMGGKWRPDPASSDDDYYQRFISEDFVLVSLSISKSDLGKKVVTWDLKPLVDADGMPLVEPEPKEDEEEPVASV